MANLDDKSFQCPLELTMALVGGKWQCVILWHLRKHSLRFNQLKRRLGDITPKMLTQQLRDLEENDLIYRKVYPVIPPKVEYGLTEYGKTFVPILKSMYMWGDQYSKDYSVAVDTSSQERAIREERRTLEKKPEQKK